MKTKQKKLSPCAIVIIILQIATQIISSMLGIRRKIRKKLFLEKSQYDDVLTAEDKIFNSHIQKQRERERERESIIIYSYHFLVSKLTKKLSTKTMFKL
jgi:hypothetical protein